MGSPLGGDRRARAPSPDRLPRGAHGRREADSEGFRLPAADRPGPLRRGHGLDAHAASSRSGTTCARPTRSPEPGQFAVQDWFYQVNNILYADAVLPEGQLRRAELRAVDPWAHSAPAPCSSTSMAGVGLRYRCVNLRTRSCWRTTRVIDTVYRCFKHTARQAAQRWGEKMLPERVLKALENPQRQNEQFDFLHVVMPRGDYDPGRADARGKPWASYYISVADKMLVAPRVASRASRTASPVRHGARGGLWPLPAMMALPDIKMLNEMAKTDIRAVHKLDRPADPAAR
jgi:hypothetical protein